MVERQFWIGRIEEAWNHRSVLWLSGVRRVGKTVLCQSLRAIEYFDCELPSVRRQLQDVEGFFRSLPGKRIVLDEIHRLANPSEVLKIAADHYRDTKVIATGSSTLQASAKFRDTLTGRKAEIWLTPMMSTDLDDFKNPELQHRFLHGGLPPFFMSEKVPERDFQEWIDSYWARDVQELFRLERRTSFQRFLELLFAHSGGIFEASRYAAPCEISRTTVSNYLNALEETWVAHVIRPFSTHRPTEIVSAPKVYAFDTGFVCAYRGWHSLRPEDLGLLWEHYVLNEIHSRTQRRDLRYWRDKRGHELDFVWVRRGKPPVAVECKWSADHFEINNVEAFRRQYPRGDNWIVAQDVERSFERTHGKVRLQFISLAQLTRRLAG